MVPQAQQQGGQARRIEVQVGVVHHDVRPGDGHRTGKGPDRGGRPRITAAVGDEDDVRRRAHGACSPHSVLSNMAQRPARASSPGWVRRVHGQQPTEPYPCWISGFTGTSYRSM